MNHPLLTTRRSRAATKTAATAAAAALVIGLSTAPAAAEGATGKYTGNAEEGVAVHTNKGKIGTSLFNLELEEDNVLKTYCIDFATEIRGGADYQEDDWENYPGEGDFAEPRKVHWLLQNSYPQVDAATLAEESGVQRLQDKQALAATQAAIWHYSNDVELEGSNHPNVEKLYDYLVEEAEELPQAPEEPEVSLRISPESAEGEAGETIGEFTLESSAPAVPIVIENAPEGTELVDLGTGEAVDEDSEGLATDAKFGVKIPEDAEPGEVMVRAALPATELHMGRLFKGTADKPTQTLISAETSEVSAEASAKVSWTEGEKPSPSPTPSETPSPSPSETPSPSPSEPEDEKPTPSETPSTPPDDDDDDLPVTGAALGGLVAAAIAAVGIGGAAMYLSKRRSSAGSAE